MRFLTLFPEAENVHLIKDVGMIPYMMHKQLGYDSSLASYKNGDYPYSKKEVAGLKIVFIKKRLHNTFLDSVIFLLFNAGKFDVLQMFHLRLRSLLLLFIFKLIQPSGKTYLKLDASEKILSYSMSGIKGSLKRFLLKKTDIISVESTSLQKQLFQKWGLGIAYIPNGFAAETEAFVNYEQKENKILSVGRIGAPEKRTEVLLEAFISFNEKYPEWTLELAGPVEAGFHNYTEQYFDKSPALKNRVIFHGSIQDRVMLQQIYASAKIFCLSSLWESFGIALVEAQAAGCYLVSSAVIAAGDITKNETLGSVFPVDNVAVLAEILIEKAGNEALLAENCSKAQIFARENFSWEMIVTELGKLLNRVR